MEAEPEGGCRSDRRERRTSELRGKEEKKAILSHHGTGSMRKVELCASRTLTIKNSTHTNWERARSQSFHDVFTVQDGGIG